MFLFSPEKLLVILAVAMVVVGPDKLPKLAGQIGALWRDLQKWRERMEREARGVFPDLPPLDTIGQAVRSPLSYLDRVMATDAEPAVTVVAGPPDPFAPGASIESRQSPNSPEVEVSGRPTSIDTFDPSLN